MQLVLQSFPAQPAPFPAVPVASETPGKDVKTVTLQTQLCSGLKKWFPLPIWHYHH